nr:alpha-(1,3)-fucosyltransferase 4 [Vulpes vulpes]
MLRYTRRGREALLFHTLTVVLPSWCRVLDGVSARGVRSFFRACSNEWSVGAFVSPSGRGSPVSLFAFGAVRAPREEAGRRRAGVFRGRAREGGQVSTARMPALLRSWARERCWEPPARRPGLTERTAPAGRPGRGSAGRELPPPPWAPPGPPRPVGVLLWWEPFAGRAGGARRPPDCWLRFRIRGCRLLADRAAYGEAQAVLFHHRDLARGAPDWPPPWRGDPRPPGQRWVWMNFESPSHSPGLRDLAGNLFNWTLSYRADSDVFVPYGRLYPRARPSDQPAGPAPPLARKRGLVAWVVSNWDERQARVRYYRQLSRHLAVDVFGRAGPGRPVPASGLLHTVARYKFYLAFENSQHRDYITEKLWRNALLAGAVPVVLGPDRANYERFLPRGAFIHVDDFPSAAALAAHLLFLDRNPAVYRRYFHWRRSYAVHITSFWDEPWCRACQAVQAAGDRPKSVRNLARWFER